MFRVLVLFALLAVVVSDVPPVGPKNFVHHHNGRWYLPDGTEISLGDTVPVQHEYVQPAGWEKLPEPAQQQPANAPKSAPEPAPRPAPKSAPEPAPKAASGSCETEFLSAHNRARWNEARLPALKWDEELAGLARRNVQQCKMVHDYEGKKTSNFKQLTQNLWVGGPKSMTNAAAARDALKMWMAEKKDYSFGSKKCSKVCGHYTQVVWKTTTHVGCAVSSNCEKGTFVSCNYAPPGNWPGKNPY